MKNSFIRFYSSNYDEVTCSLRHRDDVNEYTIYSEMSYNRITGDIHISFTPDCPLDLVGRAREAYRFIKFIVSL